MAGFTPDVIFICPSQPGALVSDVIAQLAEMKILAQTLELSDSFPSDIQQASPKVLVLDYFLGRYGTAIDVLQEKVSTDEQAILIWSDEPTLEVAVELMKLGARDYVLSTSSRSTQQLLASIKALLSKQYHDPKEKRPAKRFIAQSLAMQEVYDRASSIAAEGSGVHCIHGSSGSGRSHLAREIHALRKQRAGCVEIDWELSGLSLSDSVFSEMLLDTTTDGSTVMIDHVDSDTGELLEELQARQAILKRRSILVLLGIRDARHFRLFTRLFSDSETIQLPALSERRDDFSALMRSVLCAEEAEHFSLSSACIDTISSLPWPGGVRQLLSCFRHAYQLSSRKENATTDVASALSQAHDAWFRHWQGTPALRKTRLEIYRSYCMSGCSIRRTAAMLETDVRTVSRALLALRPHPSEPEL